MPFPQDLLEASNSNPNILVTGPGSSISTSASPAPPSTSSSNSGVPPSLSLPSMSNHSFSLSPASSPTVGDFPTGSNNRSLSRQSSFQHSYDPASNIRYDSALTTPLPPSPVPGLEDPRSKRQRISPIDPPSNGIGPAPGGRRVSRARSDSAPMGSSLGGMPGGFYGPGPVNGGYSYPPTIAGAGRARGVSSAARGKSSTTGPM